MQEREQWKSGLGFALAAAGSAVGLGNLWGFAYRSSQGGGLAFQRWSWEGVLRVALSLRQ